MTLSALATGLALIKNYVKTLGPEPGVYRMLGQNNEVLYVGKARHLKNRVLSYTQKNNLTNRLQRMVSLTLSMEFIITPTEEEALLLETQLIKKFKPRFNVLMKDDKMFPHLLITEEAVPQLKKYRGKPKGDGLYFGPFASVTAVNETSKTLSRIFQLRTCADHVFKNRTRPCLEFHIKRCSAPCVGYITLEKYQESVHLAQEFLLGKTKQVQTEFTREMYRLSAEKSYESAAILRDRVKALNVVQDQSHLRGVSMKSADFFATAERLGKICIEVFFYRHHTSYGNCAYFPVHDSEQTIEETLGAFIMQFYQGKEIPGHIFISHALKDQALIAKTLSHMKSANVTLKVPKRGDALHIMDGAILNTKSALQRKILALMRDATLLKEVQEFFKLDDPIQRIEVYDNSHLQGDNPYGAMVVATPEGFDKKQYRQFKIRSESGAKGDDYGMLREVLTRRFKDSNLEILPDIVLIDGGRGQLNIAAEIIKEKQLPILVVGIAKGEERNAGEEMLYFTDRAPIRLEKHHPVAYYLQRLRDEVHRFVIGTHRTGRTRDLGKSTLLEIPGVGPARKKKLLVYFGSVAQIKKAQVQDLAKVDGISYKMAEHIFSHL